MKGRIARNGQNADFRAMGGQDLTRPSSSPAYGTDPRRNQTVPVDDKAGDRAALATKLAASIDRRIAGHAIDSGKAAIQGQIASFAGLVDAQFAALVDRRIGCRAIDRKPTSVIDKSVRGDRTALSNGKLAAIDDRIAAIGVRAGKRQRARTGFGEPGVIGLGCEIGGAGFSGREFGFDSLFAAG